MSDLTSLTAKVQKKTSVESSALTLVKGISAQFAQVAHDHGAVRALINELNDNGSDLAAAVTENTSEEETPEKKTPEKKTPAKKTTARKPSST